MAAVCGLSGDSQWSRMDVHAGQVSSAVSPAVDCWVSFPLALEGKPDSGEKENKIKKKIEQFCRLSVFFNRRVTSVEFSLTWKVEM